MFLGLSTSLSEFYKAAEASLKLDITGFILCYQGTGLNREDSATTLQSLEVRANAIVDVLDIEGEKPTEIHILVEFGGNLNPICINELEPFNSIRERIAEIISKPEDSFEMYLRN